ncbi:MAG TPA: hypothetical protein PLF65_03185, partial [Desulfobacter postgatei]|nr:hypothetical protein [Desulfobacter postgatei]
RSPIGIAFSTQGRFRFANPQFTEMFGSRIGDEAKDIYVHLEDRERIKAILKQGEVVHVQEMLMYDKQHRERDMLTSFHGKAFACGEIKLNSGINGIRK